MNKKKILLSLATIYTLLATVGYSSISNNNETIKIIESKKLNNNNTWDIKSASRINFTGDKISAEDKSIIIKKSTAIITKAGTYHLSGVLNDGNIIVDVSSDEIVKLVLDEVDISSSITAPIFVKNSKKTIIITLEGSKNSLSDTTNSKENKLSAVIFSKDDLSIYGKGLLNITANYKDGIKSNDGLILNANINIVSQDDGIIGKDYLIITGGKFNITAKGDGFKSNNDEDNTKGNILIEEGNFNIKARSDAFQAKNNIEINSGIFDIISGGGSDISLKKDDSGKGLKAGKNIELNGGVFIINSSDDTIHANNNITINQGVYTLSSGDDGIHSDKTLTMNGGKINITKSYEGIESSIITINKGELTLVSRDDGLNAAGGNNNYFYMKGGKVIIDAEGDGIDVNGDIEMSGGTIFVNGPTKRGNGAIDYDGFFKMTGGLLIATSSSGMEQAPSESSTQYAILQSFNTLVPANTMLHIETKSGENILSYVPTKEYKSIAFSSVKLRNNTSYSLYYGGSDSSDEKDGLYNLGTYTKGTLNSTFTISSMITSNIRKRGGWGHRGGGPHMRKPH